MGVVSFIPQGRMGNFLFEAATAFAYAKKHGLNFSVPLHSSDAYHSPIYLRHLINESLFNRTLDSTRYLNEEKHSYHDLFFDESWRDKNIILRGYFQSEKYFKEYREELLGAFKYLRNYRRFGIVAVHVRRGDYLTLTEKHPAVPVEWLLKAMSLFPGKRFQFYSDDIGWCKETFGDREDCMFSNGTIEEDLVNGACCEHHINSSSTYSWWMAWLNTNPDKIVITPKDWFTPKETEKCPTQDIVPETWIKL